MLKKIEFNLGGQTLKLSAISALDYLNYVEYLNSLEKPEKISEDDSEQDLNRKLNQANKLNLLANTRLIAVSLSYSNPDKTIDDLQNDLLNNWTHTDILTLLGAVQDVCEFPEVESANSDSDNTESGNGEPKNA